MMYATFFYNLTPMQIVFVAICTALFGAALLALQIFVLDDLVKKLINKIFK